MAKIGLTTFSKTNYIIEKIADEEALFQNSMSSLPIAFVIRDEGGRKFLKYSL